MESGSVKRRPRLRLQEDFGPWNGDEFPELQAAMTRLSQKDQSVPNKSVDELMKLDARVLRVMSQAITRTGYPWMRAPDISRHVFWNRANSRPLNLALVLLSIQRLARQGWIKRGSLEIRRGKDVSYGWGYTLAKRPPRRKGGPKPRRQERIDKFGPLGYARAKVRRFMAAKQAASDRTGRSITPQSESLPDRPVNSPC